MLYINLIFSLNMSECIHTHKNHITIAILCQEHRTADLIDRFDYGNFSTFSHCSYYVKEIIVWFTTFRIYFK